MFDRWMNWRSMVLFSDGGGAGGDGGGGGTVPASQAGGDAASGGGENKPAAGAEQNQAPAKTFTQAEVDLLAGRIRAEERQKLEKQARELGFNSVDELLAAAKAQKEAEEAAKSELERAKAAAEKAKAELEAVRQAANLRLIKAEVKVAASQAGAVDPDAVWALIQADEGLRSQITVDAEGNVTGAEKVVAALLKAKPYLKAQPQQPASVGGTAPPANTKTEKSPEEIAREIAAARKSAAPTKSFWSR